MSTRLPLSLSRNIQVIRLIDSRVPIYSAASWVSLVSLQAAQWIDPLRDVYEVQTFVEQRIRVSKLTSLQAFTIYTFLQLLVNFLGGERSLIIMMHGRPPVSHLWPLSHFLPKVDISDPHTFLGIKRGILQYAWLKPILALTTIVMKATGTLQEGVLSPTSGYLWIGIVYNVSITVSLYALAMFWICMSADLKPFRPVPKFLCIKGIIFASYWQGFFLSILVHFNAIPDEGQNYRADNLAVAIQDALICFEMPAFAILHWYAFSWKDYADTTISAARLPVKYALRDAFGPCDLVQDAKETFAGSQYEYRHFDADNDILAHEESHQRTARLMQGMRYGRSGKGKYWIPKPGQNDSNTPLLHPGSDDEESVSPSRGSEYAHARYGTTSHDLVDDFAPDPEDENLFASARALEFGDWNYPVITAHHARTEDRLYSEPRIVTTSTNRNVFQPTRDNRRRRKAKVQDFQRAAEVGRSEDNQVNPERLDSRLGSEQNWRDHHSREPRSPTSTSDSKASQSSQQVDLVVEDHEAEDIERVRARKSGNPGWNKTDTKHFLRTYPISQQKEEVRDTVDGSASTSSTGLIGNHEKTSSDDQPWEKRDYTDVRSNEPSHDRPTIPAEENVWNSPKR